MSLPMYLELASYLTNEWSLCTELKEDMGINGNDIIKAIRSARAKGIVIEKHDGKIRLDFETSIDQVRLAIFVAR